MTDAERKLVSELINTFECYIATYCNASAWWNSARPRETMWRLREIKKLLLEEPKRRE